VPSLTWLAPRRRQLIHSQGANHSQGPAYHSARYVAPVALGIEARIVGYAAVEPPDHAIHELLPLSLARIARILEMGQRCEKKPRAAI
jgi:hypothetical protein